MKEALFLKRNIDKWKRYESDLEGTGDPDVLAAAFIELTDDLAYARTFYPDGSTARYLNSLASGFYQKLYSNRKESAARIWSFWQYELPFLFGRYRRYLLYAFLFFVVFAAIGALSASRDPAFVRLVLGDHYVNTTLENIRKGDPFGVYGGHGPLEMFCLIAFNNIRVAFLAYVFGITGGVLTVIFLMQNGIMIGSFEAFFFRQGLGWHSVLAVFIHGTIELSVFIVAGGAGLLLGSSLLFPGTYSRWHALVRGGRDAMKMAFGLVPFFLVAAFLESFVTRHYRGIPLVVNLAILGLSLAGIVWYFILYPYRLEKRIAAETAGKEFSDETSATLSSPTFGASSFRGNHRFQSRKNFNPDNHFNQWLNHKLNSEK